ncbi:MAG: mechanosensitive ion channel family protein [Phycisphaerales bacterium]
MAETLAQAPVEELQQQTEAMRKLADELQSMATTYGLKLLGAVVFIIIAWLVAGWISRLVSRGMTRAKVDLTLAKFLSNVVRWGVLAMSVVACLGIFGIQTASFAAVIGAAGLAIGLAFQGTLSNLAAGAMLLIFRPFKVGDAVVVAGQAGVVDEIELFTTKLDTADNRRIILPNSAIFGTVIENQSHHPVRRGTINICVSYEADVSQTRDVLTRAVTPVSGQAAGKPPEVALARLGPLGVDWEARVWAPAATLPVVHEAAAVAVKNALESAKILVIVPPHARPNS